MAEVEASDGVTLYAEAHGSGIPLLLTPGYCQTHENFRGQIEPLCEAGARVVLWDLRGHGKSSAPRSDEGYSMTQVVDDLKRVIDWAVPGERAVIGGLSFGGLASLHFALNHLERTRALLLIASGPGFKNEEAQEGWESQVRRIAYRLETRGFQGYTDGRAAATAIGRKTDLPAAVAAGAAIVAQDPRSVAMFGRRVAGPAPCVIDDLRRIGVPALVLLGADDKPYIRAGEVMNAKLPDVRHVLIPDAAHVVNIEQADAFNRAVAEFLSELKTAQAS